MRVVPPSAGCADCGADTGKRYARYCAECRWTHRGKPSTYRLTPEREAYLRAHYRPAERGTSSRCAVALDVPKWRVCRWAAQLGLTSGVRANERRWTPDEDALLERVLGRRHPNWIAKQLQRSVTAIVVRGKRLGLSRLPDGYSQGDVALAFGVERGTVERWQRRGWLTASFQPCAGQPYRFTDNDLRRFVRQHPCAFTLAKVDQVWFLDAICGIEIGRESAA